MTYRMNIYNSGMNKILSPFKYLLPIMSILCREGPLYQGSTMTIAIRNSTKSDCTVVTFSHQ